MTKYVCLLRGINVGGNTLIKMSELKATFEIAGFSNVSTYINSGNVLFETTEKNQEHLTTQIEKLLANKFKLPLRVVIRSHDQLKNVISGIKSEWTNAKLFRCYIGYVKEPLTPTQAIEEIKHIKLKAEVDFLKAGSGVIYMITKMDGLTSSGFTKLIGTKVYKEITIRNFNTTKKILELMETKLN